MDESYLVTGGCGLQGSAIVQKLLEKYPGAKVAVVARNPTINQFPGATYHRGDITMPDDVARVMAAARPTVVFHCAAVLTVGRAPVPDAVVRAVNVDGTRLLLEHAARVGVKALVFCSSASVTQVNLFEDIRDGDETMPVVEESTNTLLYPKTKAEGERLTLAADTPGGMRTCILRPASIYGERDNDQIPGMMRNVLAGRAATQLGDNKNLFDHTYAGNAADAHLLAAEKLLRSPVGVAGEAFLITDGLPLPMFDFVREVARAAGRPVAPGAVRVIPTWAALAIAFVLGWVCWIGGKTPPLDATVVRFATMNRYYNIGKARERLGYEPAVEWKEGVRRGVEWYLANQKKE